MNPQVRRCPISYCGEEQRTTTNSSRKDEVAGPKSNKQRKLKISFVKHYILTVLNSEGHNYCVVQKKVVIIIRFEFEK